MTRASAMKMACIGATCLMIGAGAGVASAVARPDAKQKADLAVSSAAESTSTPATAAIGGENMDLDNVSPDTLECDPGTCTPPIAAIGDDMEPDGHHEIPADEE